MSNIANYRIYGRKKGQRGGCFNGFYAGSGAHGLEGEPSFGGQNLIHCPVWWDKAFEEVQAVCNKIMSEWPQYECKPVLVGGEA